MFSLQCIADAFFWISAIGCRIKFGRLIEVRLDCVILVTIAPATLKYDRQRATIKFNRLFVFKIHAKISFLLLLVIFKDKG